MPALTLCLLIKYPPTEGGVSQQGYWLARNLAAAGHRVHVVTNGGEVASQYRMFVPSAERGKMECEFDNGGFVRVHRTHEPRIGAAYIPYANPFVSKLTSLAVDVVRTHGCDLIWSSYLEPNGVAALLTSKLTDVPYVVRHAGSDIVALAQIEARKTLYFEVMREALLVSTSRFLTAALRNAGVPSQALYATPSSAFASGVFVPDGPRLDIRAIAAEAEAADFPGPGRCMLGDFDPALPVVGIYGKASPSKGMGELAQALGQLAASGERFNFVTMVGSHGAWVSQFRERIEASGLAERTTMLPFLPHWLVPQFIRSCTVACYLENRFPVQIHTPQVGWEIMACGTPLVVAAEVAHKAQMQDQLVDGHNVYIVDDPEDVPDLARVVRTALADPDNSRQIGQRGVAVAAPYFPQPEVAPLVAHIERKLQGDTTMALREFQKTLADLYTNETFRQQLFERGAEALQGRDLSEIEQQSLHELGRTLAPKVQWFGTQLAYKRLEYYLEMLPTVAALLHVDLGAVRQAFGAAYDFKWRPMNEDIEYFIGWLRSELARAEGQRDSAFGHPALGDAIRFDLALWNAETEHARSAEGFGDLATMTLGEVQQLSPPELDARVQVAPGVALDSFEYPVHRLASEPEAAQQPQAIAVAFSPRIGVTPARAHILGAELKNMLVALSEPRAVRTLAEEVSRRHPTRNPEAIAAGTRKAVLGLMRAQLVIAA